MRICCSPRVLDDLISSGRYVGSVTTRDRLSLSRSKCKSECEALAFCHPQNWCFFYPERSVTLTVHHKIQEEEHFFSLDYKAKHPFTADIFTKLATDFGDRSRGLPQSYMNISLLKNIEVDVSQVLKCLVASRVVRIDSLVDSCSTAFRPHRVSGCRQVNVLTGLRTPSNWDLGALAELHKLWLFCLLLVMFTSSAVATWPDLHFELSKLTQIFSFPLGLFSTRTTFRPP